MAGKKPHKQEQPANDEGKAPVYGEDDVYHRVGRNARMDYDERRKYKEGYSEREKNADGPFRIFDIAVEKVGEYLKYDEQRETVFERDGKPIGIKVCIGIGTEIGNDRDDNFPRKIKNDVEKEKRETLVNPAPQKKWNKSDFKKYCAEPWEEVNKMHKAAS